jgi:hypothetical protein
MFQRTLAGWAMDMLELRRRGLDRPCQRGAEGGPAWPGETGTQGAACGAPLRPFQAIPAAFGL